MARPIRPTLKAGIFNHLELIRPERVERHLMGDMSCDRSPVDCKNRPRATDLGPKRLDSGPFLPAKFFLRSSESRSG